MIKENRVIEILKQCYDPEIPIDLWSLGLIYNISIDELDNRKSNISITMTLTTPGCSMGSHMAEDIKTKLEKLDEINLAEVNITFSPLWKPKMMNNEARKKLGFDTEETEKSDNQKNWE